MSDLEQRVTRHDKVLENVQRELGSIMERLKHMPTKSQILTWGVVACAVIIIALWHIITVLLAANNAPLAAQIARAVGH